MMDGLSDVARDERTARIALSMLVELDIALDEGRGSVVG